MRKPVLTVAAALGGLLLAPVPAQASVTVASWQMNEGAGAGVMVDSSGHGHNGSVGSRVITGYPAGGSRGYKFRPGAGPSRAGLVTVADSSALNPGTSAYAVTVRLRTASGSQNIIQKGQATTAGGYFKIDMTHGRIHCEFRDSSRRIRATGSSKAIDDGRLHTIRCARSSAGVSATVDGTTHVNRGPTGSISNGYPVSIGGKLYCRAAGVGCDRFVGVMDYIRIES
jgi:Laminin G domain